MPLSTLSSTRRRSKAISYKGEYHYRSGSTKQVLRGAALNQFLLRKHGRNWDDAPMPGVGLADLDGRALDEFRRRGVASGRLPSDAVDGSDGDLMEMLRLREGHYLRCAAVLLFYPDPACFFAVAFVKIGYFRTETDLAYQDVIEGKLFAQVERTVDLLPARDSASTCRGAAGSRVERGCPPGLRPFRTDSDSGVPPRITLWNPGSLPPDWTLDSSWACMLRRHTTRPSPMRSSVQAWWRHGDVELTTLWACARQRAWWSRGGFWSPVVCGWSLCSPQAIMEHLTRAHPMRYPLATCGSQSR